MYGKIKHLHFVGVGGIGMSGIAEVLITLGYRVTGSDRSLNANTRRLTELGAQIHQGHDAALVEDADAVVFSSAVDRENPELRAARERHIPLVSRAEMLAELMRLKYSVAVAGTHGKTTTTSLIATILGEAGKDPTVVNGGILKALGSNARLGQGDLLVAEADESDGSFLKLLPSIAVITNIDPEHLEHYGSFEAIREAFFQFASRIPFYGALILCRDHPVVAELIDRLGGKRVITYGGEDGHYRAVNVRPGGGRTLFGVVYHDPLLGLSETVAEIRLPLFGQHNVHNALAAIAVARELDIPWKVIGRALAHFGGVQRRFDLLLETPERVVIDDYAHHPVEILATLQAAREVYGSGRRVVAIFQPHRYSRVRGLLQEFFRAFAEASLVLVLPIYAAGESTPPEFQLDGGQGVLIDGLRQQGGVQAEPMPEGDRWREQLAALLRPGEVTVFLGAGDISQRARHFAQWCREQDPRGVSAPADALR